MEKQKVKGLVLLKQGETYVAQADGEKFAAKYLGNRFNKHVFFRNSGECKFYIRDLWKMSPDNNHIMANEEGFIEIEELKIRLDSEYVKGLAREVRCSI